MSDVAAVGRGLPLGGPKQRAALAALLLRANETVPAAKIVDDVWGEHPPATAAATLEVYVSRLRGLLGRGEEVTIEKRPAGYMLRAPDAAIDAHRFQQLTQAGRRSAREDPGAAAELFREALGLWRGAPLEDVVLLGESSSEPERLEEMQLRAREDLLELRLRSEAPDALLDELDGLVRRRPFREQLRGALMLSLYRSGRQAEALAVYEAGRRALVDELGLSPSHELRQLASAIVRQEAALDVSSPSLDARPDSRAGSHLRWATAAALGLTLAAISIFAAWIGSNVGDAAPSAAAARPRVTLVRWQAPPAARAPLEDLQREGLRRAALAYGVRTRVVAANQSPLGAEQALEAAARRADLVIASVSSLAPAVAAVHPAFPARASPCSTRPSSACARGRT